MGDGLRQDLKELIYMRVFVREVTWQDSDDILRWRNDRITRENSFDSHIVSKKEHDAWFQKVISDSKYCLVIGFNANKEKVGIVSFNFESQGIAEINVNSAPDKRGHGLGSMLIKEGVNYFLAKFSDTKRVVAKVKEHNIASIKSFEKAGFSFRKRVAGAVILEFPHSCQVD